MNRSIFTGVGIAHWSDDQKAAWASLGESLEIVKEILPEAVRVYREYSDADHTVGARSAWAAVADRLARAVEEERTTLAQLVLVTINMRQFMRVTLREPFYDTEQYLLTPEEEDLLKGVCLSDLYLEELYDSYRDRTGLRDSVAYSVVRFYAVFGYIP